MLCSSVNLKAQDQFVPKAPLGSGLRGVSPVICQVISEENTPRTLIKYIMDEAFSHLGTRYRSGAKGPNAFDCSGFTGYVFKQFDHIIGASSRDQYAKNTPIKRSDMRRGDLVFFTSARSGGNVGHVGIVVDVDPNTDTFSFIHASTRYGVIVSRSNEGYYAQRFVGVRRVI